MKVEDKCKTIFRNALIPLGWLPINSSLSRIYMKNNVYLVLYNEDSLPPLTNGDPNLGSGYCKTIHAQFPWCVLKDGFVIDEGKMSKFISEAYDIDPELKGPSQATLDTLDLINRINSYSEMTDNELLLLKQKESFLGELKTSSGIRPSSNNIGQTRLFMVNPELESTVSDLKANTVYAIERGRHLDDGNIVFVIVEKGSKETVAEFTVQQLGNYEKSRSIFAVEEYIKKSNSNNVTTTKMFATNLIATDKQYEQFNLSLIQKASLCKGILSGGNFTPLLENSRSADEAIAMVDVVATGCDITCLLGKHYSPEVLQVLSGIASNGFSLNGFCDEGISVEDLKSKYSNFSSTMDQLLTTVVTTKDKEVLQAYKQVAFYMNGINHLAGLNCDTPVEVLLHDFKFRNPEFATLCDVILQKGLIETERIVIPWSSLDTDVQRSFLGYFETGGLCLNGTDLDDYFFNSSYKIDNIYFTCQDGIVLSFEGYQFFRQENSFAMRAGNVFWRAVHVNEEYFVYQDTERIISL